jgi:hypothetical protein
MSRMKSRCRIFCENGPRNCELEVRVIVKASITSLDWMLT